MDDGADLDENAVAAIRSMKNRIMTIVSRSVSKMRVIVCMDELVKNDGKSIAHLFSPEDLRYILMSYKKYNDRMDEAVSKDSFQNFITAKIRTDVALNTAVRVLFDDLKVGKFADCYVSKMEGAAKKFYDAFLKLSDVIEKKTNTFSTELRNYEKQLGKSWKRNEIAKLNIKKCEKRESNVQKNFREIHKNITHYQALLKEMTSDTIKEHYEIITASEKIMDQTYVESEDKLVELSETAVNETQKYEKLLEQHLKHEQTCRKNRFKLEMVLANWFSKYDQEIYELQKDFEEIKGYFEMEKELMDELQAKFDDQEGTYIKCMEEKMLEEERIFDENFLAIMRYFSARKIQKWWRYIRYKKRKKSRKRNKKKGKKRKKNK